MGSFLDFAEQYPLVALCAYLIWVVVRVHRDHLKDILGSAETHKQIALVAQIQQQTDENVRELLTEVRDARREMLLMNAASSNQSTGQ